MMNRAPLTASQLRTLKTLAREPAVKAFTHKEMRWLVGGVPKSGPVDRLIRRGFVSVKGDHVHINKLGLEALAMAPKDA